MSDLNKGEYQVGAVISFYTIFHIPREKHQELLKKIDSFLQQGGFILITMGVRDLEDTENDFYGEKMWWSQFGAEKNNELVKNAGFQILLNEIDTSGGENHQIILAKKT